MYLPAFVVADNVLAAFLPKCCRGRWSIYCCV